MNQVDCANCGHHFETQTFMRHLAKCPQCRKSTEVPETTENLVSQKKMIAEMNAKTESLNAENKSSLIKNDLPIRVNHSIANDIEETQFEFGLTISSLIGYFGLFLMTIPVLITIVVAKSLLLAIPTCISLLSAGSALVLVSHIARATMKTADYTRICALNSMNK